MGALPYPLESWGPFGILLAAFWIWMILDCARNEPRSSSWMWILIIFNVLGAAIYFFARKLPNLQSRSLGRGPGVKDEIRYLEGQVRQIPNAYYFSKLGEAYLESGKPRRALERFEEALRREPNNLASLLGAGRCRAALGDAAGATAPLEQAHQLDANYRMGLAAETLLICYLDLGDDAKLQQIRAGLPKINRTPQLEYVDAYFLAKEGRADQARKQLEDLIYDVRHLPRGNFRAEKIWLRKSKRLLRSL